MANESQLVQKLIKESKKLTEANIRKYQSEQVLKELTLFKNLSTLLCNSKTGIEKVFKAAVKVYPQPYQPNSNLINKVYNQTVILTVENASKFSLNPNYWQFVIDMQSKNEELESQKTIWSIENPFDPGNVERFSLNFHSNISSPVKVCLRLIFSIEHGQTHFSTTLCLSTILIDALYLLSPTRIPRLPVHSSDDNFTTSPTEFPPGEKSSGKRRNLNSTLSEENVPSVTQFFFRFDSELTKLFLRDVLLKDSVGFTEEIIQQFEKCDPEDTEKSGTQTFKIYLLEEEVLVVIKLSANVVSFKSSNSKVLVSLKSAILQRLLLRSDIHVKCPNDSTCENIYALKLRLEAMAKGDLGGETDIRDYMDFFLELRDISETIGFVLVRNVE